MTICSRLLVPSFAVMIGASALCAADPAPAPLLPYQGRLIEAGQVVNGNRIYVFSILDSTDVELWNSGNQTLTVTNGLYSALLGGAGMPAIPASLLMTAGMKLRVTVAGQVLTPDVALVPTLQARSAWEAEVVTGVVTVTHGGTGATDVAGARANLGLGAAATAAIGTTAGTVAAGDDARFADARTPIDDSVTSAKILNGTIVNADVSATAAINWTKIDSSGAGMVGATGSVAGSAGLVPAPVASDNIKFLRGDATWQAVDLSTLNASNLTSGTAPVARLPILAGDAGSGGTAGIVPAPAAGDAAKFLRGDGTWTAVGGSSLPSQTGNGTKFLTTDGSTASWATVPATTDASLLTGGTLAVGRLPALSGDVTTVAGNAATTVAQVGGATAANVAAGANLANAATNANTASAIVRRDGSGNFSAGTITATGFSGSGASLTSLNASSINSGTVPAANLPAMVGDSGSGGTRGAVPAPAAGDAAAGKFLKADGTWATASGGSLPAQTGNGSKFLTTDGTTASWATPSTNATALQSNAVSSSAPAVGDSLVWNGSAWAPASANKLGGVQIISAPSGAFTANVLVATDVLVIDKGGDDSAVTGTVNFPAGFPNHKVLRITSLGWSTENGGGFNITFNASGADKIMSLGTRTESSAVTTWSGSWSEWLYDSATTTWYMLNCY